MLFKILHGDDAYISLDIVPFHEGYCYVTYGGNMYVDMNTGTASEPNNQRIQLNAANAQTLCGMTLEEIKASILNDSLKEDRVNELIESSIGNGSGGGNTNSNGMSVFNFTLSGTVVEGSSVLTLDDENSALYKEAFAFIKENLDSIINIRVCIRTGIIDVNMPVTCFTGTAVTDNLQGIAHPSEDIADTIVIIMEPKTEDNENAILALGGGIGYVDFFVGGSVKIIVQQI